MSEIVEEEPEPLPLREYGINLGTGLAYDGLLSNDYAQQEEAEITPEMRIQEKRDVWRLTEYVNELLPSKIDSTIQYGDAFLRRRLSEPDEKILYFFKEQQNDRPYCRSWAQGDDRVNFCLEEVRHEPAIDVLEHIMKSFEGMETSKTSSSRSTLRFGSYVLAKLLHSS